MQRFAISGSVLAFLVSLASATAGEELTEAVAALRRASATEAADAELQRAWRTVADADAADLPTILRAMDSAGPAAENWLRAAADAIAERTLAAGKQLPREALVALLKDTAAPPRGRRVAYEWLERIDADKARELLEQMLNDPSLELRYDAVAAGIAEAEQLAGAARRQAFQRLLTAARDLEQVKTCRDELEALGEEVVLAKVLGFVTEWRVIGPFDNTDQSGFDIAYPPEREIDFSETYDGKSGEVTWLDRPVVTNDEMGEVDLAEALGPEKGAVAYAYSEFLLREARSAVIRYASPNATKLWVNGSQLAAHEAYHSGGDVDQFVVPVELEAGTNTILLKVCQNEQTEPWAQVWSFQLRVTDELATAIHPDEEQ